MSPARHPPPHPGLIIRRELSRLRQKPTIERLAAIMGVSRPRLSRVMNGHARVKADLALRLTKVFGRGARFWMDTQASYDLWEEQSRNELEKEPRCCSGLQRVSSRSPAQSVVDRPLVIVTIRSR